MSSNSRLLLEIENLIRKTNKEIINPVIPDLHLDSIQPVMEMVARARASYLKALFDVTESNSEGVPTADEIRLLASHRLKYEELIQGAKALDIAIERGYLDIAP